MRPAPGRSPKYRALLTPTEGKGMEGNGTPPEQEQVQSVSDETLPHPQSEPVEQTAPEPPPVAEHVDVPCAGCGRTYGFDIKPNTATFTFQCRSCGTRSEWVRQD